MKSTNYDSNFEDFIPKIIIQTYHRKEKIPSKIYENIQKYSSGYQHIIFDDNECRSFLKEHYDLSYVHVFNNLRRGPHKADFFRYCYLYKFGGVYLDIKVELLKPLDEIITHRNHLYTVLSLNKGSIFQAILFCPKEKPILKLLIDNIIQTNAAKKTFAYNYFTIVMYQKIKEDLSGQELQPGRHEGKDSEYYLFQEKCDKNPKSCYDGLDRHGFCCFTYDENDEKVFKNRYSDFGRRW